MREMQSHNRASSFLAILFILLFVILIVGIIGFFYFSQPEADAGEEGVKFWLYRHPSQIVGDESTFFVFIRNQEVRNIENAQVVINFPQGFVLNTSTPECEQILVNSCQWSFDSIKKGTLKDIELKGQLFGQADQPQFFTGSLHFQLQGFTSEFQKNLSSSVMISPALHMRWDMDKKGTLFDPLETILAIENITSEQIDEIQVILQWPQDFEFKSADSEGEKDIEVDINARTLIWNITDLNFYDKEELVITGEFIGAGSDALEFKAQAGIVSGDDFFVQAEEKKNIALERFDFVPELKINNRKDSPRVYSWGDTLPIRIEYVNNINEAIKEVSLAIEVSTNKYIDLNHLYSLDWSYYSGPFVQKGTSPYLTGPFYDAVFNAGWDKTLIPGLEKVSIAEKGVISFDLPLKQSLNALKSKYFQAEFSIRVIATGTFSISAKQWEVKSNAIDVRINTQIDLDAATQYYDDEGVVIGTGPLPPQEEKETRYWIFFNIKNTTNSVEEVVVKTRLADGATWTDQTYTTHGLLLYNENTREIEWRINELPLYVGGPYSLVEARFEISVTPRADQVGLFLPLTNDIILHAQDSFTNDTVLSTHQFLSTDLGTGIQKGSSSRGGE